MIIEKAVGATPFRMTQAVAAITWFAGLIGWYIIRQPFERRAKRIPVNRSFYDRRESALLLAALLGLLFIPAVYVATGFPASLDRPFIPALAWIGVLVLLVSLWLFRRSHADLGRNWSISLEIRDRHKLVQTGVYRLIRHPMYSSFFLLGLAQSLLLANWLVAVAGLTGAGILFAFRVRREERLMLDQFGNEYRLYMANSKRLIPWLI